MRVRWSATGYITHGVHMSDDLLLIRTYPNEPAALLARAVLEANGIPSIVDASGAIPYGAGLQFVLGVRLSVRRGDATSALALLGPE